MVCISCFIAPVVLFIWYKFVYPLVQPLLDRFIGNYKLPTPFENLSCPLPKKTVKCGDEKAKTENETASFGSEASSEGDDGKKTN